MRARRPFFGWWVAVAFALTVFLSTGVRFTTGPFLKPIVADLGIDRASFSLSRSSNRQALRGGGDAPGWGPGQFSCASAGHVRRGSRRGSRPADREASAVPGPTGRLCANPVCFRHTADFTCERMEAAISGWS